MKHFKAIQEAKAAQWAIIPASLRAILDGIEGGFSADDYELFHRVKEEDREHLRAQVGEPVDGSFYSYISGDVGILMIDGPIIPRATAFSDVSGVMSLERMSAEFEAMDGNPDLKKIVMVYDSPGGVINGIVDFQNLVKGSEKETIAFVEGMGASLAYWGASAADKVIASETAVVGSVGAVLTVRDNTEAQKKSGVRTVEIVSSQSPLKRAGVSTEEGRAALQEMVDDQATTMINHIAENRGMSAEGVQANFGRGAMFVAGKALDAGMIDQVAQLSQVIPKPAKISSFNTSSIMAKEDKKLPLTMEVETMAEDKKAEAAEVIETVETSNVEAKITEAVEAERERIKAIEDLGSRFKGAHPDAKKAAFAVINKRKFDAEATVSDVALEAFEAATAGQTSAHEDYAKGARESAEIAAETSGAKPSEDAEAVQAARDEEIVEGVAKHLKEKK